MTAGRQRRNNWIILAVVVVAAVLALRWMSRRILRKLADADLPPVGPDASVVLVDGPKRKLAVTYTPGPDQDSEKWASEHFSWAELGIPMINATSPQWTAAKRLDARLELFRQAVNVPVRVISTATSPDSYMTALVEPNGSFRGDPLAAWHSFAKTLGFHPDEIAELDYRDGQWFIGPPGAA